MIYLFYVSRKGGNEMKKKLRIVFLVTYLFSSIFLYNGVNAETTSVNGEANNTASTSTKTLDEEHVKEENTVTDQEKLNSNVPSIEPLVEESESSLANQSETSIADTESSSALSNSANKSYSDNKGQSSKLTSTPESAFTVSGDTIINYDQNIGGADVIIPHTINGIIIKNIGQSAFSNKGIKSVIFSNAIEGMESSAFADNPNLVSIELSSNLKNISQNAFRNCGITGSLTIPDSVGTVGSAAFLSNKISSLTMGKRVVRVENNAFSGNTLLVDVNLGNVLQIGSGAFSGTHLSNLTIPSSVKRIDKSAFMEARINVLTLSEGLEYIGESAFSMNSFASLNIPNSVTTVEKSAFKDGELTFVKTGTGLKEIKQYVFQNNKINTIEFSNVEIIGQEAFSRNAFVNVTIPDSVKEITGPFAFAFCGIVSVQGGKNLEIIGDNAFQQNIITHLDLEKSPKIEKIGNYAFWSNPIANLTIPDSVLSIGTSAFENSRNNKMILNLGNGIQSIGDSAFYGNSITKLDLPKSLTKVGRAAFSYNLLPYLDLNVTNPRINYGIQKLERKIIKHNVGDNKAKINLRELYPGIDSENIKITKVKYGVSSADSMFDYNSTTGDLIFDAIGSVGSTIYYDYVVDGVTVLTVEQYLAYGNIYTATWKSWDGMLLQKDTYEALYGEKVIVTPPVDTPNRLGYTFKYWSRNPSQIPSQDYYYINNDTEFVTVYSENYYIVNYDFNYPDKPIDNSRVAWEESGLNQRKPKRVGYDFVGWYYNGKLVESTDTVASLLKNIDPGNDGEITLTAKWEKKKVYFTVPDSVTFGSHPLSMGTNYYPVKHLSGSPLKVTDERGRGNEWSLSVKLNSDLKNVSTNKVLPNALVYKGLLDEKILTMGNSQVIMSHTTNLDFDVVDLSSKWNTENGLMLKIEEGQASLGKYEAGIDWTLQFAP